MKPGPKPSPRVTFEPVQRLMDRCCGPVEHAPNPFGSEYRDYAHQRRGASEFARRVGIDRAQLLRWRREGGITLDGADRIADALGLHPTELWGDDYWNAVLDTCKDAA